MRAAIDLDGVIVDFVTSYCKLLMKIEPSIKVDPYDHSWVTRWEFDEIYPEHVRKQAWTEIENSGGFWKYLFPYPNAQEDLRALEKLGKQHEVYFLTKRPGATAKWESEQWLRGNGFEHPTVVLCEHKANFCYACDIDLIVDDRPENLIGYIGDRTKRYLFRRPWNRDRWEKFKCVDTVRGALNDCGL